MDPWKLPQSGGSTFAAVLFATGAAVRVSPLALSATMLLALFAGIMLPAQVYLTRIVVDSGLGSDGRSDVLVTGILLISLIVALGGSLGSIRSMAAQRVALTLSGHARRLVLTTLESSSHSVAEDSVRRDRVEVAWSTAQSRFPAFVEGLVGWISICLSAGGTLVVVASFSPVVAVLLLVASIGPVVFSPIVSRAWVREAEENTGRRRTLVLLWQYLMSPEGYADARVNSWLSVFRHDYSRLYSAFRERRLQAVDREALCGALMGVWTGGFVAAALLSLVFGAATGGEIAAVLSSLAALGSVVAVFGGLGELIQNAPFICGLRDVWRAGIRTRGGQLETRHFRRSGELVEPDGGIFLAGISAGYGDGAVLALDGVSVTLPSSKVTAIVGPNGSGKSTLMRVVLGLHETAEGEIRGVGGGSAALMQSVRVPPVILREYLDPSAKFSDDDLLALAWANGCGFLAHKQLYSRLGPEFSDGVVFSGGEWQRLRIFRIFLREDRLLVLDEPSEGLDRAAVVELGVLLRNVCSGRIVVVVTHDNDLIEIADHVVRLSSGRVY